MKLELKNFLLTGELGFIRCGTSQEEVISILGKPPYEKNLYLPDGSVWEVRFVYGALGLFFEKSVISAYGLYMDSGFDIPSVLKPAGYFPWGCEVPMGGFLDYLRSESVPFRDRAPNEDDIFRVFTHGDVGVGGRDTVLSFVRACPGTQSWHDHREKVATMPPNPRLNRTSQP